MSEITSSWLCPKCRTVHAKDGACPKAGEDNRTPQERLVDAQAAEEERIFRRKYPRKQHP